MNKCECLVGEVKKLIINQSTSNNINSIIYSRALKLNENNEKRIAALMPKIIDKILLFFLQQTLALQLNARKLMKYAKDVHKKSTIVIISTWRIKTGMRHVSHVVSVIYC